MNQKLYQGVGKACDKCHLRKATVEIDGKIYCRCDPARSGCTRKVRALVGGG